jgi:hypothetical protein
MPGVDAVTHGAGFTGFMGTDHKLFGGREAERELVAVWQGKHPGALFWAAVRNPRHALSDTIDVTVLWYGHVRHVQPLRMWPASQFRGPEVVEPATVPASDWASPRIVLVDTAGAPLPEALQVHLQSGYAELHGVEKQRGGSLYKQFRFRGGVARVPVGEYELCLFNGMGTFVPVARCTVAHDTTELRIPITIADRVVRLHLRGLPDAGYMLRIVHESGRTVQEFGSTDGDYTLLLLPGPCIATYKRMLPDGRQESRERAFTITDAVEQEVTWDLSATATSR